MLRQAREQQYQLIGSLRRANCGDDCAAGVEGRPDISCGICVHRNWDPLIVTVVRREMKPRDP
jgi:hypothetical protein